jgi:hypothetical protein
MRPRSGSGGPREKELGVKSSLSRNDPPSGLRCEYLYHLLSAGDPLIVPHSDSCQQSLMLAVGVAQIRRGYLEPGHQAKF